MFKKKSTILILISVLLLSTNVFALAASDSDGVTITLTVGLVADFSASPLSGTAPLTVNFTDLSSGVDAGATYSWSFGDGGSSTDQNPSHTYTSAGTYTVSLTVTYGAISDTETKTGYITVTAPEVPVPPGGGAGPLPEPVPPIISQVEIIVEEYAATISWQTNEPATTEIEWGRTIDYEEGSVVVRPDDLILEHEIRLENLEPDTVYHFRIKATDAERAEAVSEDYSFRTLVVDLIPPANISDFIAIPDDQMIILEWVNPPDEDFAGVKIMRSTEFFPLTPQEGQEIYNSDGTEYVDTGLENGQRYYYTGFAYDESGNFASGAIVTAFPWPKELPPPPIIPPIIPPIWPPVPPIPPLPPVPPVVELTIQDVSFFQEGKLIFPDEDGKAKLIADLPAEVSAPADKLPYVLKSVILNIALPTKKPSQQAAALSVLEQPQSVSYLLKINPEKTAYQATIVIPRKAGKYDLTLMILNYYDGTITKIKGQLIIRQPLFLFPFEEVPAIYALLFFILVSLIILLIAYIQSKRKEKRKKLEEIREQGAAI